MKDLINIENLYKKLKPEIDKRIKQFKDIWASANEYKLFQELAFCLLTPQSKAYNAWQAIENLSEENLLKEGKQEEISEKLNTVRFKNNKAKYILKARELFLEGELTIRAKVSEFNSVFEAREWLVKNVLGYGWKEASHFLRNIGFVEDITILDRHILKNLVNYKVIQEIPKSISGKTYINIENKMKKFSKKIDIPVQYLDLIFWYSEAGSIFK